MNSAIQNSNNSIMAAGGVPLPSSSGGTDYGDYYKYQ